MGRDGIHCRVRRSCSSGDNSRLVPFPFYRYAYPNFPGLFYGFGERPREVLAVLPGEHQEMLSRDFLDLPHANRTGRAGVELVSWHILGG